MKYRALRTVHLLCGVLSLPFLLMYGVSAVQMAHSKWFVMRPVVSESRVILSAGSNDGRVVAREAMRARRIAGEIATVTRTAAGFDVRIVVPGTVHEIRYDAGTGTTRVRTSVAGTMGMLNRLHHAAGLWPSYRPLWWWGAAVAVVSLATVGLGLSGLWMWWVRRQDRVVGLVLLVANLAFALVVLVALRVYGP